MTPPQVSRWIRKRFSGMHRTRLKTLSAVLMGFLECARLGVCAIGRGMGGPVKPRHRIKRVDRFLSNARFDQTEIMAGLLAEVAARCRRVIVALDWVELRGGFRALVAAACTGRGRALPVAWAVVSSSKFYRSQNSVEEDFVRLLARLAPDPSRLTLVADRGFARAALFPVLDGLGLGYVIRVRGRVQVEGASYRGWIRRHPLAEGQTLDLGTVSYCDERPARTRLVLQWSRGADEPIFLATNLSRTPRHITTLYAQRMQEEESFRDMKSHRYGFALRYAKLSRANRYAQMLVLWALGMWLLLAQGAQAVARGLHHGLSTASNRRRDLSLIRIGVLLLHQNLGPPPQLLRALKITLAKRWG